MGKKKSISNDAVIFAAKAVEDAGRQLKVILNYADCDLSDDERLKGLLKEELPRRIANLNNILKNLNGGKKKLKLDRNFISDEFYDFKTVYNYLDFIRDVSDCAGTENPEAFVDILHDSIDEKIDLLGNAINGLTEVFDGLE